MSIVSYIQKLEDISESEAKIERLKVPSVLIGVIEGKYGSGETRRKKLKAEGYDPATVQKMVNEMVKGTKYA